MSLQGRRCPRSLRALADAIEHDPELERRIREDPARTIREIAEPLRTDAWIYRMVVGFVGLALLAAVGAAIGLAARSREIPDFLVAVGSGALGALAGLLAPSPREGG